MSLRERVWIALMAGLLCGAILRERIDAQSPSLLFGVDSASGLSSPIQTNGSNALKVLEK